MKDVRGDDAVQIVRRGRKIHELQRGAETANRVTSTVSVGRGIDVAGKLDAHLCVGAQVDGVSGAVDRSRQQLPPRAA